MGKEYIIRSEVKYKDRWQMLDPYVKDISDGSLKAAPVAIYCSAFDNIYSEFRDWGTYKDDFSADLKKAFEDDGFDSSEKFLTVPFYAITEADTQKAQFRSELREFAKGLVTKFAEEKENPIDIMEAFVKENYNIGSEFYSEIVISVKERIKAFNSVNYGSEMPEVRIVTGLSY